MAAIGLTGQLGLGQLGSFELSAVRTGVFVPHRGRPSATNSASRASATNSRSRASATITASRISSSVTEE